MEDADESFNSNVLRSPLRDEGVTPLSLDGDDCINNNTNSSSAMGTTKTLSVMSASESSQVSFECPHDEGDKVFGLTSPTAAAAEAESAEAADTATFSVSDENDANPSFSSVLKSEPRYYPPPPPPKSSSSSSRTRIQLGKSLPGSNVSSSGDPMMKRAYEKRLSLSLHGMKKPSTGSTGVVSVVRGVGDESCCVVNDNDDCEEGDESHHNSTSSTGMLVLNRVQKLNPFKAVEAMMAFKGTGGGDRDDSPRGKDRDEAALARLSLLLSASTASAKKTVPAEIRERRAERLSVPVKVPTTGGAEEDAVAVVMSTKLHELCAGSEMSLIQLQTELARSPSAVSMRDSQGRLPLHVLGDNMDLISTPFGKSTATTFALQLMRLYPKAITTPDSLCFFPFVSLIQDWEQWSYETHENKPDSSKMSELFGRVAGAVSIAGMELSGRTTPSERRGSVAVTTTEGATTTKLPTEKLFPRVDLWEEVGWCFEMLSLAMDELGKRNGGLYESEKDSQEDLNEKNTEARNLLSQHLPSVVPSIVKTVLLVDGGGYKAERERLLKSSIFRAMLLQPESVGAWLTSMIRKGGLVSRRAIDYLALVSGTTIDDYVGGFRPSLPVDKQAFHLARTDVFNAINELEGTVASLVILGEREIERAVSSSVISYIMAKNLSRPFVVSVSLVDFVLQIVLLMAFRTQVSAFGESVGPQVPTNIVYFICFHYLIRKASEASALFNLSPRVFRSYIVNLWNVFDLFAIVMVFVAYSWNQANPNSYRNGFNTFVLGLMWLKILTFMKVVNKEMSTFIIALGRILKDLVYFAIVLLVVILMFADMFRIAITTKDNGEYCQIYNATEGELEGAMQDFCSTDLIYSALRTYALLLGDFSLDEYKETPGMLILFVIFTAIGVIILLNVLIAVISDSYEVAKLSSHRLFGRARVGFVAQNEALESFLRPGANPLENWNIQSPTKALVTCLAFLRWGVLLSLLVTAMFAEFFLIAQAVANISDASAYLTTIFVAFLGIVLTCALWILVFFSLGGVARAVAPGFIGRVVAKLDTWTGSFSKFVASRLFGLSKSERTPYSIVDEDDAEDEWLGRTTHLERSFDRTADRIREEIKAELKAEIAALENRLYERDKPAGEAGASEDS